MPVVDPYCIGIRNLKTTVDLDGHRTYTVTWLVEAVVHRKEIAVRNATNLPRTGQHWAYNGEIDTHAILRTPSDQWYVRIVDDMHRF